MLVENPTLVAAVPLPALRGVLELAVFQLADTFDSDLEDVTILKTCITLHPNL